MCDHRSPQSSRGSDNARRLRPGHRGLRLSRWAAGVSGVLVLLGMIGGRAQSRETPGEWRFYSADAGSTKYSPLDHIRKENVTTLRVAWRHVAVDPELKQSVRGLTSSNN